jgi:hypothetical protein
MWLCDPIAPAPLPPVDSVSINGNEIPAQTSRMARRIDHDGRGEFSELRKYRVGFAVVTNTYVSSNRNSGMPSYFTNGSKSWILLQLPNYRIYVKIDDGRRSIQAVQRCYAFKEVGLVVENLHGCARSVSKNGEPPKVSVCT